MTQQASHSRTSRDDLAPSPSGSGSSAESTEIYPYSIGDKEIVLSNGTIAVPEDDLVGANPNINVVESSGVRIGHDTVFNGDVTLIQHVYAQGDRGTVGHTAEFKKEVRRVAKGGKRIAVVAVATLVLASLGTACGVYRATAATGAAPRNATRAVVERSRWLGRAPTWINETTEPASRLIVGQTGGGRCRDLESCRAAVQHLQNRDMDVDGLPDIRHNFLVGGDGNVYVGRGWGVRNGGPVGDGVDVAFVGEFSSVGPPPDVYWVQELGSIGLWVHRLLRIDFCVVVAEQTGERLREEIAKLGYRLPKKNSSCESASNAAKN